MTEDIDKLAKEIARNCKIPEDFTEFFKQLKRRGLEAALAGELTNHLGYEKHDKAESRKDNSRNSYSKKKIQVSEGEMALDAFSAKWDDQYPYISASWRKNWERAIPLFDYPADIRRAIYTTNAIESLNITLRKVIKNKRMFPSDEAVFKLLYLAIERISQKWAMPIHN
ncbi:MAG: transposase [Gammaproteobacteria bacterium]|nr:transposase [Gammaproteobacteria bacterium]